MEPQPDAGSRRARPRRLKRGTGLKRCSGRRLLTVHSCWLVAPLELVVERLTKANASRGMNEHYNKLLCVQSPPNGASHVMVAAIQGPPS